MGLRDYGESSVLVKYGSLLASGRESYAPSGMTQRTHNYLM